jgi:hypothetical protein
MVPSLSTKAGGVALARRMFAPLILVLFTISLVFSPAQGRAQQATSPASHAQAEGLTRALVALNNRIQRAPASERALLLDELLNVAIARYKLLASLIGEDPTVVLRLALPERARARMPAEAKEFLEQHVELEGTLGVLYEDYENAARLVHTLERFGERFSLHFADFPTGLLSGTEVRARGVVLWTGTGSETAPVGAMALESGEDGIETLACCNADGGAGAPAVAQLPNTFGEQRTLMLLVNFQDNPSDMPWTLDQARSLVFDTVSDFLLENSFQQTWLAGDAYGWYTIAVDSTNCNTTLIAQQANTAAAASGVALSDFARFIYLFPRSSSCSWSGVGTVGGNPSQTWINGKLELKVIGHELGHNFGLQHSHALECGATTLGANCQTYEYGDRLDMMGNHTAGHFNAFQKEQLGWLGYGISPPITTLEFGGTYLLEPYELGGASPLALKVLKGIDPATGVKNWYYLEYRQALGFDSFLIGNDNILNGVVLHTGSDADRNSSLLLDMTPASSTSSYYDWDDHALESGVSYSDPGAGITLTTAWTNGGGATINVDFGSQVCVRNDPVVSLSPSESQWMEPGTAVTYALNVTNRDNDACGSSQFDLQVVPPSGWTASLADPAPNLQPGESTSTSFTVTSPASAPDGFYTVEARATNIAAASYSASGSLTYVVNAVSGNQAPVAMDDSTTTVQGTAVLVTVLANDWDPDGDPLLVTSITQGTHGQVSVNGDGTVNYLPDPRFKGVDSFSYAVSDGIDTADATVAVSVERGTSSESGGGAKGGGKPGGK